MRPPHAPTAWESRCRPTVNSVANVVDREEPLGLCHRFEAPHMPLAPPSRLVGDFGPVVGVAGGVVDHRRHDDPVRAVAPEAIGDEAVRDTAAPLEQLAKEPRGGVAIPAGLEQDVDDLAILVDGPPEVLTLAAYQRLSWLVIRGLLLLSLALSATPEAAVWALASSSRPATTTSRSFHLSRPGLHKLRESVEICEKPSQGPRWTIGTSCQSKSPSRSGPSCSTALSAVVASIRSRSTSMP
jgi:hypothetical protein